MSKKYNPITDDHLYWKYQGLVKSWIDFIKDSMDIDSDDFKMAVAHLAGKLYRQGYYDASKYYELGCPIDEDNLVDFLKKDKGILN